jgi:hypothetical protein
MAVVACACGLAGFASGAYYQFRHTVFLQEAAIGRDILVAKICARDGCDSVRGMVTADLPMQLSNYSVQYAAMQEPFPRGVLKAARNTWAMRHFVDGAMKPPEELQRAISDCKCGLQLQPANQ